MIEQEFTSEVTKDIVSVSFNKRFHKAYFKIVALDDVSENVKLVSKMVGLLKQNDVKWICFNNTNTYDIPPNTVWYNNNGVFHCHIEDYEKFYLKNMSSFVNPGKIVVQSVEDEDTDGWTVVTDQKKAKRTKLQSVTTEIVMLSGDWSNMSDGAPEQKAYVEEKKQKEKPITSIEHVQEEEDVDENADTDTDENGENMIKWYTNMVKTNTNR